MADEQPARRLAALIAGSDVRYPLSVPVVASTPEVAAAADVAPTPDVGPAGPGADPVAEPPTSLDLATTDRHPLAGCFVPDLALRSDEGPGSIAGLMRAARPVLLVLADRPELRTIGGAWAKRVDVHTAETDDRPADALLIRPDAHVAWAAAVDAPADAAAAGLRAALTGWFGPA